LYDASFSDPRVFYEVVTLYLALTLRSGPVFIAVVHKYEHSQMTLLRIFCILDVACIPFPENTITAVFIL
jgi:hypothetical protein